MAQLPYTVIEHTADIGIEVRAKTLEELFARAAFALFDIQMAADRIRPDESFDVEVHGSDRVDLLVAWLSELQYRFETTRRVFSTFDVHEATETSVKATCRGERYTRRRHGSRALIKAVTYHQAAVEQEPGGWFARMIFDV